LQKIKTPLASPSGFLKSSISGRPQQRKHNIIMKATILALLAMAAVSTLVSCASKAPPPPPPAPVQVSK